MTTLAKVTKSRPFEGDIMRAIAVLEDLGHGPYFAITCDIRTERGRDVGGGAMLEGIARTFPETLGPYIKWHLVSFDRGPMHYEANALYWAGMSGYCDGEPNDPPNADHFRSTVVYGAVEGDTDTDPMELSADELSEWLRARYPALMQAFREDMRKLFGEIVDRMPG